MRTGLLGSGGLVFLLAAFMACGRASDESSDSCRGSGCTAEAGTGAEPSTGGALGSGASAGSGALASGGTGGDGMGARAGAGGAIGGGGSTGGGAATGGDAGHVAGAGRATAGGGGVAGIGDVCPGVTPALGNQICRSPSDCTGTPPYGAFYCSFPQLEVPRPACTGCGGPDDTGTGGTDTGGGAASGGGTVGSGGSGNGGVKGGCPLGGCPGEQVCSDNPSPIKYCCPRVQQCVDRCTADTCGAGERCNGSGFCEALPCGKDYTCPPHTVCGALYPDADPHGCTPEPCDGPDSQYQCPDGTHCDARTGADDRHCRTWCSDTGCPQNQICGDDEACAPKPCAADSDCDCGVCGNKVCQGAIGSCYYATGGTSGGF